MIHYLSKIAKIYFVIILTLYSLNIFAQIYNVGHTNKYFYDNARNIAIEIYYPSDTYVDYVTISLGHFPIIVLDMVF